MKLIPIGPNQTELSFLASGKSANLFFSYQTPVAAMIDGICYKTDKKWSATTSRHITKWLDGANAETKPQAWFDSLSAQS